VGEKTGESRDGNLYRKLAEVELVHGRQGEKELLSTGEMSWWWKGVLVARGFGRRSSAAFYTGRAVHGAPGPAREKKWCGIGALVERGGGYVAK
jgi:hypothetical protein